MWVISKVNRSFFNFSVKKLATSEHNNSKGVSGNIDFFVFPNSEFVIQYNFLILLLLLSISFR